MANYLSGSFMKQSFNIPAPDLTEKNSPRQDGRVYIVTGGYAGVGEQLSKILYDKGAKVYVAGRSKEKAETAIQSMKSSAAKDAGQLQFLNLDLNDLSTIKLAVETFLSAENRLDVLVNNAGVMFPPAGTKTKQGHDMQFGTNCLGPFLFTELLLPILKQTAQSSPASSVRITWAGSVGIQVLSPNQGVEFDASGQPRIFDNQQTNYGQTKVGNLLLAIAFQDRLSAEKIVSTCFNPGNLKTELQRHTTGLMMKMAESILYPAIFGAYTELWAAASPDITVEKPVRYVIPWGKDGSSLMRKDIDKAIDDGLAEKFYEWCDKETKQYR